MIVFYISGHGFGHASRDIEVINALAARAPALRVQVRTAAPRWLFDLTARAPIDLHEVETDTGLVQIDSLRIDVTGSKRRAETFYAALDRRAVEEARGLEASGARLVVGDVPPLAFAAADRAGVPAFALANFTWDWIYEEYLPAEAPAKAGDEIADAPRLLDVIRAAYARGVGAWRLPMCGGFEPFARIVDVPLIARHSRRDPADVRRHLGVPLDRPLVLSSFGGFGVRGLPFDQVDCLDRCTVVVAEATVTRSEASLHHSSAVVCLGDEELYEAGFRYEDLVAAADVVITKPGFGIIAECAANRAAIVYTSRGRFREYDVLVREMPRFVRSEFLSQEDLLAGRWWAAIDRVLSQPTPPPARTDGADVVADLILQAL